MAQPTRDVRPEVIDGQQRLATCVMLIAAIRDYLLSKSPDIAMKYERDYLIDFNVDQKDHVPNLKLNVDDSDFFLDYVLRRPDTVERKAATPKAKRSVKKDLTKESHRLIYAAAQLARDKVRQLVGHQSDDRAEATLTKWVSYLHNQARVIWFSVPDRDHAYTIFETLNDRGLDLSKSDLLKNHLYDCVPESDKPHIQQYWAKMRGALDALDKRGAAATYIRHLWIAAEGPTREKALYGAIKKKITRAADAKAFVKQLADTATLYTAMFNPRADAWADAGPQARRDVAALLTFKAERIRPLMLACMTTYKPEEMKRACRLFVSWSARFIVAGGVAGTIEEKVGAAAKRVTTGELDTADKLRKELTPIVPSDTDFELAFANAKVTSPPLARYYMWALENVRKEPDNSLSASAVDESQMDATLEHVLPQNPNPAWGLDTPEGQLIISENYNRIGNLALMSKVLNEEAGNNPFTDKKPVYAKDKGYYLTTAIAKDYDSKWGAKEIEDRQAKLAKLAVKAWPLKPY